MSGESRIAILMATYNGAKYLREQIDSILRQTCSNWVLYIHDDGSADSTCDIAKDYSSRYPDKIVILDYASQGGACMNFLSMLRSVDADYYMFSDQDDVWMDDKIEKEWNRLRKEEESHPDKPVVVFSDLIVTDSALQPVHRSLWTIAGIYPQYITNFSEMAANTLVTGCTMLFNRKVKDLLPATSKHVTMHDAWIACCTMKNGGFLLPVWEPTVLYRQHGANTLGAQNVAGKSLFQKILNFSSSYQINKANYLMLKDLSYGSMFKYIWYNKSAL